MLLFLIRLDLPQFALWFSLFALHDADPNSLQFHVVTCRKIVDLWGFRRDFDTYPCRSGADNTEDADARCFRFEPCGPRLENRSTPDVDRTRCRYSYAASVDGHRLATRRPRARAESPGHPVFLPA